MNKRLGIMLIGGFILALSGCSDPLFPRDLPRTPYERYQVLRRNAPSDRTQSATRLGGMDPPTLRRRLGSGEQP